MKKLIFLTFIGLIFSACSQKFVHEEKYFVIEQNCLNGHSDADNQKFLRLVQSGFDDGLACLDKIDAKAPRTIAAEIRSLLEKQKVKVFCPADYHVERSTAYADSPASNQRYGYLTITLKATEPDYLDDLDGTILHELIHLPGYHHHSHIDYSSACGAYCFPKTVFYKGYENDGKDAAYRICSGQFTSVDDPEYLRYFNRLAGSGGTSFHYQLKTTLAFIVRNPKSRYAKFLLALTMDYNSTWHVGDELMRLLKEKYHTEKLNPKEVEYAEFYQSSRKKHAKDFSEKQRLVATSKLVAHALFNFIIGEKDTARKEAAAIQLGDALPEENRKKLSTLIESLK